MRKFLLEKKPSSAFGALMLRLKRRRSGSFLVESTISLFVLVSTSIVLLDASFNILRPRVWTMKSNLVDAYLSQEVALMNAVDFDAIADGTSGWGNGASGTAAIGNAVTQNNVVMGRMPGFTLGAANGRDYTATVHRIRIIPTVGGAAVANNAAPSFLPDAGTGRLSLSELGINCYELQTHVVYQIGNDTYVKTRSVIRSQ